MAYREASSHWRYGVRRLCLLRTTEAWADMHFIYEALGARLKYSILRHVETRSRNIYATDLSTLIAQPRHISWRYAASKRYSTKQQRRGLTARLATFRSKQWRAGSVSWCRGLINEASSRHYFTRFEIFTVMTISIMSSSLEMAFCLYLRISSAL